MPPSPTRPIHYTIRPVNPSAHLFAVSCTVLDPEPEGQLFRLPAWIPGSYMIREFARNIVSLRGEVDGKALAVEKIDKHSWRTARVARGKTICLYWEVYAWDLSVRGAHLDSTHGFFNGTSVFLEVVGRGGSPCTVDILAPEGAGYRDWRVATTLPSATGERPAAARHGFGRYRAADYDELIDHPVEMGRFSLASFDAGGVEHEVAITGRHDCDLARLTADLSRVCNWHIELFGAPPPMTRYLFLATVVGEGYGGLEHRASTALLANRGDLPWCGMRGVSDGYKSFLGLCSHEYFHTWNVKRIKPAAFTPYDLAQEAYTRLLWAFEGFTSYYDDLALVRSGVIEVEDYLGLLGKTISNVLRGSGRLKQSVAESSFDAWIKYYRQDENAPNAIVSYYAKGALVALALDLQLRAAGEGRSLDDVMRLLWRRHGQSGTGVAEDGVVAAVAEVGGVRLARWLERAVDGTDDLPLARLLKGFGVDYRAESASKAPTLGVKLAPGGGEARLANVFDDGAAQRAGLAAGDVLVAMDGLRVTGANIDAMLSRRCVGDRLEVHAFRRDELMRFDLVLAAPPSDTVKLTAAAKPRPDVLRLRRSWLGR